MEYGLYIIIFIVVIFIPVFIYFYLQNFTDFFEKKEQVKVPDPIFQSVPFVVTKTPNPQPDNLSNGKITISTNSTYVNDGDVYLLVYTQNYGINKINPIPKNNKVLPSNDTLNTRQVLIFDNTTKSVSFESGVDLLNLPSNSDYKYKVSVEFLIAPSQDQINTYLESNSSS